MKNIQKASIQPMKNTENNHSDIKSVFHHISPCKTSQTYCISLWKTSKKTLHQAMKNIKKKHQLMKKHPKCIASAYEKHPKCITSAYEKYKKKKKPSIQPLKNIQNKHSYISTQNKHNIKSLDNLHDKYQCSIWCLWHLVCKVMVGTHLFKTISHNRNGNNWQ